MEYSAGMTSKPFWLLEGMKTKTTKLISDGMEKLNRGLLSMQINTTLNIILCSYNILLKRCKSDEKAAIY